MGFFDPLLGFGGFLPLVGDLASAGVEAIPDVDLGNGQRHSSESPLVGMCEIELGCYQND